MNVSSPSPWLHRFAWLIAALTLLLPVATGATVTTLKAGMVFSDWPSSDGHNMLAYPWWNSARDQFVEHGHRLAGMVIGLLSISLVVAAWFLDRRRQVRVIASAILATVVAQGLLGGARVLLDKSTLALVHGDFAVVVFSLMATLVLITSNGWDQRARMSSESGSQQVLLAGRILLGSLIAQYVMGGFLRHLRDRSEFAWAWMVHPWFAVAVLCAMVLFVIAAARTDSSILKRCALVIASLAVAQSLIGLATWYVKYGVPSWGVVAQQDSLPQIIICSLHTVVGMLTLMTSILTVVCCSAVRPARQNDNVEHVAVDRPVHHVVAGAAT
jgi:cytochrome c oxidase assembly protein subunit 15